MTLVGKIMAPADARQRHGFTLIELMVVVAIVIILLVVGVAYGPRYVARRRMEQVCVTMVQDMQKAQADAIFKRTSRTVVFDIPDNSYQCQDASGGDLAPVKLSGGIAIQSATFGGGTYPTHLIFTSFGEPDGGEGTVTVTGPGGLKVVVRVSVATGRVSMDWQ